MYHGLLIFFCIICMLNWPILNTLIKRTFRFAKPTQNHKRMKNIVHAGTYNTWVCEWDRYKTDYDFLKICYMMLRATYEKDVEINMRSELFRRGIVAL